MKVGREEEKVGNGMGQKKGKDSMGSNSNQIKGTWNAREETEEKGKIGRKSQEKEVIRKEKGEVDERKDVKKGKMG